MNTRPAAAQADPVTWRVAWPQGALRSPCALQDGDSRFRVEAGREPGASGSLALANGMVDALLMQADEDYRGGVYDRRLAEAEALRERQDTIRKASWVFGPTPAMLDLSVRIAGADADTQRRFEESAEGFRRDLVGRLNQLKAVEYPDDPSLAARIKAYELAFRMQSEAADVFDVQGEPQHIHELYGDTVHGRD